MEKYLALEAVRTLLKKHSKVLNNLQEEDKESPSSTSKPDEIDTTFEADSGDSDGKKFLK